MAVYRGQYWALLEELRAKYRRFCMRTGESGWKEPAPAAGAHPSATGGTGGPGEGSDFPFPPASRPHALLPPPPPPLAPPFPRDTSLRAAAGGSGVEGSGAGGDRGSDGEGGAAGGIGVAGLGGAARPEPHAPDKPANATLHCAAPGPCLAKPLALSVFWAPIAGRTCPAAPPPSFPPSTPAYTIPHPPLPLPPHSPPPSAVPPGALITGRTCPVGALPFPPSPPSSAPTTATSSRQLSSPSHHVTGGIWNPL
ncbi:unnamed protein product [Closterium sp. Naga37s-1]|nr:unnamed protein product [Closterium sp. Naga37s-1]